MSVADLIVTATLTAPQHIGTSPASLLWLLPLTAAFSITYKATTLPTITAHAFIKEVALLFGSIIVFMAVTALVLFAVAWIFTS